MKLSDRELDEIFEGMNLPPEGREFVRTVRAGPPDRNPNTLTSVTGRIASTKMGHAVRSESRSGEVVAIGEYESDPDVLEFWDQIDLRVPYSPAGTDRKQIKHTVDFVVISRRRQADGSTAFRIEGEEWREQDRMVRLAAGDPERWKQRDDGDWTQVPVERWLAERGIDYRIRIIGSIPAIRARNHKLLADYRIAPHPFSGDIVTRILDAVMKRPAITLADVLLGVEGATVDDLFALIAQGSLKANLDDVLLTDHGNVHLYEEGPITQVLRTAEHFVDRGEVRLEPGSRVRVLGTEFHIVAVTAEHVLLNGPHAEKFRIADFNRLIAEGDATGLVDSRPDAIRLLQRYSITRQEEARVRLAAIQPSVDAGTYPQSRTHQRWLADYREAEVTYGPGNGILGLLSDKSDRGNYDARLSDDTEIQAAEAIRTYFLNPDQLSKNWAYRLYTADCTKAGVEPMSRSSFYRRINAMRLSEIMGARWGKRAAYGAAPRSLPTVGAPHGEHAQARVHLDHTPSDVETVDSVTGANLGIPFITLLVEEKYRYVTGASALYEDPSSRSDMLAMREHVKNTSRLPTTIVTDNGKDFHGKQFQAFCAIRGVSIEYRKSGDARDGSTVEGTLKQLMNDLL